jgi:hypothetical protein
MQEHIGGCLRSCPVTTRIRIIEPRDSHFFIRHLHTAQQLGCGVYRFWSLMQTTERRGELRLGCSRFAAKPVASKVFCYAEHGVSIMPSSLASTCGTVV